jgi:hypothetical protein
MISIYVCDPGSGLLGRGSSCCIAVLYGNSWTNCRSCGFYTGPYQCESFSVSFSFNNLTLFQLYELFAIGLLWDLLFLNKSQIWFRWIRYESVDGDGVRRMYWLQVSLLRALLKFLQCGWLYINAHRRYCNLSACWFCTPSAQNAPNVGTILVVCISAVLFEHMKLKLDVRWVRGHLGSSMRASYTKVAVNTWVLVNSPS